MMYTHFMIVKRARLGPGSDAQTYEIDLSQRVNDFNELFSKKSDAFLECKLNGDFTGVNDGSESHFGVSKRAFEDNLCSKIPAYLENLLKRIQDDITEAKGDTKKIEEIQEKNITLLKNIYEVREAVIIAKSDLMEYRPYSGSGKRKPYNLKSSAGDAVVTVYDNLAAKYKDLFEIGIVALNNEKQKRRLQPV